MQLKVKKLAEHARLPSYAHEGDAGMDLFSAEEAILKPLQPYAVPTGISIEIPEGFVGLVWDKSGLALKGIKTMAGVIDSGYRGEIRIVLINLEKSDFKIENGTKIAQLLIQPVARAEILESHELSDTARGHKAFGSTGLK